MKTVIFIAFILIVTFAQTPNKGTTQTINDRRPEIAIDEALDIAKTYVQKHKIDVSESYIDSVQLNLNPQSKKGKYWEVTWQLNKFAKGGQVFLHVHMNKSVEVYYGE